MKTRENAVKECSKSFCLFDSLYEEFCTLKTELFTDQPTSITTYLFKTLIKASLRKWQLKDNARVIIFPINKAKPTICIPLINIIHHLT